MDREHTAIARLQEAAKMAEKIYGQPLVVMDSGGKDSTVLVELARRAGIPFEVMHNHTTADAPETVYFVRDEFHRLEDLGIRCTRSMPVFRGERTSMWSLIPKKMRPPTRKIRYCCSVLKERGGQGRFIATGVRWAESARRKNSRGVYEISSSDPSRRMMLNSDNDENRQLFETCRLRAKRICNPIIDWEDRDVWEFIRDGRLPLNPLYAEGWNRVGCVGCPMAGQAREMEFARWPKYREMYIRAFDRMLEERRRNGMECKIWNDGAEVYHWWMEDGVMPGQVEIEDPAEPEEEDDG